MRDLLCRPPKIDCQSHKLLNFQKPYFSVSMETAPRTIRLTGNNAPCSGWVLVIIIILHLMTTGLKLAYYVDVVPGTVTQVNPIAIFMNTNMLASERPGKNRASMNTWWPRRDGNLVASALWRHISLTSLVCVCTEGLYTSTNQWTLLVSWGSSA